MPESLVPTLLAPFAALEDPRLDRTKRYNLLDIIFIALCAVVSGANDCVALEKFGKSKRAWLEKYLSLPDGTPCHDTFTRVFAAVDGEAFVACFLKWVKALQESTDGQLVAIDGKTARAGQTHLNLNKKSEQRFANLIVPGRLEPFLLDPPGDRFVALEQGQHPTA